MTQENGTNIYIEFCWKKNMFTESLRWEWGRILVVVFIPLQKLVFRKR